MRRLRGRDAHYLYEERPYRPHHTLKVLVLDGTQATGPLDLTALRAHVFDRSPMLPVLREVIARTPLGLAHPLAVDMGEPDLDKHVLAEAAAPPGGRGELQAVVSRLAAVALPTDRPLWRLHLVEGLQEDQVALVLALHHAIADGQAGARLLEGLFAPTWPPRSPQASMAPEQPPGPARRVAEGLVDTARLARGVPALLTATVRGSRESRALTAAGTAAPPPAYANRPCPWDAGRRTARCWAAVPLPRAELDRVRRASASTLSELLLAVVAGALRRTLLQSGRPARSLLAGVPSGLPAARHHDMGNHLGQLTVALPADLAEPAERVAAVVDRLRAARAHEHARGPELMASWLDCYPLLHAGALLAQGVVRLTTPRPPYALSVASVRGPASGLTWAGAPVVEVSSVPGLFGGMGLSAAGWSYGETVTLGVLTVPGQNPTAECLAQSCTDELKVLESRVP